jgi:4-hydroxybenzoyl-CoA thioesterase
MGEATNRRRIRVEFGNCDPARIVFYPTYFAWFDQGTMYLFESVGLKFWELPERFGVLTPIVEAQARFSKTATWGDDLDIESRVSRWSNRSMTVAHVVRNAASGDLICEGHEVRVFVRSEPGRMAATAIPPEIRALLSGERAPQ